MNHTSVTTALDRLRREVHILEDMRERGLPREGNPSSVHIQLLLQQSKRVRSCTNLLIKALARERDDNATAQEGTS